MNELEGLKDKKEKKKKGFLAWLREKFGFSPKGMGQASEGARGINLTRGLGSASRGAGVFERGGIFGRGSSGLFGKGSSSGILSFLGGKSALITAGLVTLAVVTTLYMRQGNMGDTTQGPSSLGEVSNYTPRIVKEMEKNTVSSLDMLKNANQGAFGEEKVDNSEEKEADSNIEKPSLDNLASIQNQDKMGVGGFEKRKLQTNINPSLTSELGSKFSALGGFGSHFGKFGPSVGSGKIGGNEGFANISGGSDLKRAVGIGGKLSPMVGSRKPQLAKGGNLASIKGSKTAFGQAQAVKGGLLQPTYGTADGSRFTVDNVWDNAHGKGTTDGGAGVGPGNAGGGEGGGIVTPVDPQYPPDNPPYQPGFDDHNIPNVNPNITPAPWQGLIQSAMMLLMIVAVLAAIAAAVSNIPVYGKWIALAIAAVAVMLALKVIYIGYQLQSQYGQAKLGMLYMIGGAVAAGAAIAAALSGFGVAWAGMLSMILAAGAMIISMLAAMAMGPAVKDYMKDQLNKQQQEVTQQTQQQTQQTGG